MKRLALALALSLLGSSAWAQTCPTRAPGDNTNACATTAFVTTAVSGISVQWANILGKPANVTALGDLVGANNTSVYFTGVGTMATYSLTALGRANAGVSSLTSGNPVIGQGTSAVTTGTKSGNTTVFATTTGSQTSGNCVSIDANGNHVAAGSPCGTGGGTTQTSTCASPITVATTDTAIYVNAAGACTINLPATGTKVGSVTIYDNNGTAASNNFTINPSGAETINGAVSVTFATPYGALVLAPITPGYSATHGAPLSFTNRALLVGRGSQPPVAITADTTAGRVLGTTAGGDPAFTSDPLVSSTTFTEQATPSAPSAGQGRIWLDSTNHNLGVRPQTGSNSFTSIPSACSAGQFYNAFSANGNFTCGTPTASALQSKVVKFTRDLTAASGNVAITGCGFQPTSLQALGTIDGGVPTTWGITDSARLGFSIGTHGTNYSHNDSTFWIITGAGDTQAGVINSYDADGFTIGWTKTGSPTGTITIAVKCMR